MKSWLVCHRTAIVFWTLLIALIILAALPAEGHYDSQDLWHWLPEVLNEPWDGVWE